VRTLVGDHATEVDAAQERVGQRGRLRVGQLAFELGELLATPDLVGRLAEAVQRVEPDGIHELKRS
jgi:hypothetical protein